MIADVMKHDNSIECRCNGLLSFSIPIPLDGSAYAFIDLRKGNCPRLFHMDINDEFKNR
jgi:hypothetical protein